ncbi:MAG TPA: M20/M25/M40 family metallo-hydrolase [Solirubrobacterales bacterium]|jgi:acetylornithine deacetylase/succinyl-diaminopimelate desuccinylase-like protein
MSTGSLRDEVVDLARALIGLDTSNPPGNETPAAELLAEYLRGAGVDCELLGPDPQRLNLVARIAGAGEGPSLMLLAHTDVVPAPSADWTVDPFGGVVRDGFLVGRGATDMKSELAARAVAFAALARSGARPAGDVVLVAEADEERNTADVGMSWLVRERPDLRCDCALNEGGGTLLGLAGGGRVVTVSIGEKQVTSLRLRVFGTAGHASVPQASDNPLRHAATAIERLLEHPSPTSLAPAVAAALDELGAPDGSDDEVIAWAAEQHPALADWLPAMTRITVTPTGAETFEPANVIPPFADLICDCRPLPGQSEADIRAHVAGALGDDLRYELELLEPLEGGTQSPTETPLYRLLEDYVADRVPGATLLPLISTGFTDSHWVRRAFGTAAYGFAPVLHGDPIAYLGGAHGADEALELADLVEMAEFHLHAARTLRA